MPVVDVMVSREVLLKNQPEAVPVKATHHRMDDSIAMSHDVPGRRGTTARKSSSNLHGQVLRESADAVTRQSIGRASNPVDADPIAQLVLIPARRVEDIPQSIPQRIRCSRCAAARKG
jgi:hypothetical protein